MDAAAKSQLSKACRSQQVVSLEDYPIYPGKMIPLEDHIFSVGLVVGSPRQLEGYLEDHNALEM